MIERHSTDLDLTTRRVIKAPRRLVWDAWTDPRQFEQWWIPAPLKCKVEAMDLRPGGSFVTRMSEGGGPFVPHLSACFLEVVENERIAFTNTLLGGWRPANSLYPCPLTAIISLGDHPQGTEYTAYAMHGTRADRDKHEAMGFHDGWGTVAAQLAAIVERRAGGAQL